MKVSYINSMAISDVSVGVMMDNLNVLPRYNQCVVVILVVDDDAPTFIISDIMYRVSQKKNVPLQEGNLARKEHFF